MKKIFYLLLLMPFASFSQCSTWIGEPVKNSLELLESAKSFMQFPIAQSGDTSRTDLLSFGDENGFFTYSVRLTSNGVRSIFMNGPTDKVEQFLSTIILPAIKPCEKQSSSTWIFWNDVKLIHTKNGTKKGVPMSSIQIEKS